MANKNPRRALPRCVYQKHGAYWYVKNNRWRRLDADLERALAAYAKLVEPKAATSGVAQLIEWAFPEITKGLAENTCKAYRVAADKLSAIFVEFQPHEILPRHVAKMKRDLSDTPMMVNRMISVLRSIFAYAVEQQLVDSNPATGIKKNPDSVRERLISPEEFAAIRAKADPRLQLIMDLWFLTGQRVRDVLGMRRADLQEEGIFFRQQKSNARLLVRWTPELRAAVESANALNGNVRGVTLFIGKGGKAPDYTSVFRQWQAACQAAGVQDVQQRDLRAMALTATEAEGKNPSKLAGHRNPQITLRYLRAKQVPVVDGPSESYPNLRQSKKK